MSAQVPPIPSLQKVEDVLEAKLDEWIQFFRNLSSNRITIVLRTNGHFPDAFKRAHEWAQERINQGNDPGYYELLHWPDKQQVVFLVYVDYSNPIGSRPVREEDTYVFCFGNRAFGLDYFHWDGDFYSYDERTWSLQDFSDDALSWSFIAELIASRLQELEQQVPVLKKKKMRRRK